MLQQYLVIMIVASATVYTTWQFALSVFSKAKNKGKNCGRHCPNCYL